MKINGEQRDKFYDLIIALYEGDCDTPDAAINELYGILGVEYGEDAEKIPFCPLTRNRCREDCAFCHFELGCVIGNLTEVTDLLVKDMGSIIQILRGKETKDA